MRWSKDDIDYLKSNVGRKTITQIAEHLGKSEMAVQLYMHRNRISQNKQKGRNLLVEILRMKFVDPAYFTPNRNFFEAVKMSQKHFWDLFYGRQKMTEDEYLKLIEYFHVSLQEAFTVRQLNIFEEDD